MATQNEYDEGLKSLGMLERAFSAFRLIRPVLEAASSAQHTIDGLEQQKVGLESQVQRVNEEVGQATQRLEELQTEIKESEQNHKALLAEKKVIADREIERLKAEVAKEQRVTDRALESMRLQRDAAQRELRLAQTQRQKAEDDLAAIVASLKR